MPTLRSIIAALSLLLLTLSCAHAATLNVPTSQYPTIQAGINAAAPGDTVLVGDGTYTGPGNVDLDFGGKNITVKSVNGAAKTIIDCQGSSSSPHRGFFLHSGETATATINGFTVKNGYDNGGGGISADKATISNCTISGNSTIMGTVASYTGGGIYISGGIVSGCTVSGNIAGGSGGGISANEATISNCTVTNNTAYYGGGIYADGGVISNCVVARNNASGDYGGGGGIYTSGTIVSNCTISGNNASVKSCGGGIYEGYNSTVSNCMVSGNVTGGCGGGIYAYYSTVSNCTVSGNTADHYNNAGGGGIGVYQSTVTNCTLTGNIANITGSGVYVNGGTLANCILWNDQAGSNKEVFTEPNTTNTLTYCDVRGGFAGTGNINADPLFVRNPNPTATPLDYGDLHLRPGSPCLGAGTANGAPTTDLDGTLRPNPPSIGAYEVTNAPIPGRFDFNMDGSPDLLWHNTSTGQTLVWNMSDQNVTAYGSPFATVPNTDWTVAATADVNGDGHPDLLWQNTRTGQVLFWLMGGTNGQQVLSYGSPFATVSDTHWHVVSMADFNGDGHPDMLWQNNATNQLVIWYLNGSQVITYGNPFATVSDTHWQVAGVADFDGDGRADLLWENSATGQVLVWNLGGADGTSVLSYGSAFATVPNTA